MGTPRTSLETLSACAGTAGRPTNPHTISAMLTNKTGPDPTPSATAETQMIPASSQNDSSETQEEVTADGLVLFCACSILRMVWGSDRQPGSIVKPQPWRDPQPREAGKCGK